MIESQRLVVLIRGAGDLATGVGWVLAKRGFYVVMTEIEQPLMIRWPVSFGTAIYTGQWEVEGIISKRIQSPKEFQELWNRGAIPVVVDPDLKHLKDIQPQILVDAILAKRNLGTRRDMASLTLALGPGFYAGEDVDIVVETNRGHNLARLIYEGEAEANTGIPGQIDGLTGQRVIYSTIAGIFKAYKTIGEFVSANTVLGEIVSKECCVPVIAPIPGVLRGLLRDGLMVEERTKLADIDPRGVKTYCWTLSEKTRSIGLATLFAILEYTNTTYTHPK